MPYRGMRLRGGRGRGSMDPAEPSVFQEPQVFTQPAGGCHSVPQPDDCQHNGGEGVRCSLPGTCETTVNEAMDSAMQPPVRMDYLEISYARVVPFIGFGSNNYIHANSCWGNAAKSLFDRNTLEDRKFLAEFSSNLNIAEAKYRKITGTVVCTSITVESGDLVEVTGANRASSIWGKTAKTIFNTNTRTDRLLICHVWNTINKFVPETSANFHRNTLLRPVVAESVTDRHKRRTAMRRRRQYHQQYYQQNASQITEARSQYQRSQVNLAPEVSNPRLELIKKLTESFTKSIMEFPTQTCESCDKLVYPSKSRNFKINPKIKKAFHNLDHFVEIGTVLRVCERCHSNMSRGSLSPQVKYNNLELEPISTEIQCLSPAEVRLISQVKLFMKVFLLSNGRGQPAMKGLAIHFPLKVNEVIEQLKLPSALSDSDLAIVAEDFTGIDRVTELQICKNRIYEALIWLKANNPLYANIDITPKEDIESSVLEDLSRICIQQGHPQVQPQHQLAYGTYKDLVPGVAILRATTSQDHLMYAPNCGTQCTAMSAAFLAFSFLQSPRTWTTGTLDQVLLCGNNYYTIQRPTAVEDYLNVDEISGVLPNVFQSQQVFLEIEMEALPEFQGHLNRLKGKYCRLKEKLEQFIDSDHIFAIFTSSSYSMGMYKDSEYLYFFDSHCRGSRGAKAIRGTACVIKYGLNVAAGKLSFLIHKNIQNTSMPVNINERERIFAFTITPFKCSTIECPNAMLDEDTDEEEEALRAESFVQLSRRSTVHVTACEKEMEENLNPVDEPPPQIQILETVNGGGVSDCVIGQENFIEPPAREIIELHRTAGRPLSSHVHKNLDLLAFPHLFPSGVNGVHQERKIKITPPDYYQQRLMSAHQRFSGNTDFLFYGLDESDKFRVQQKIGIVCAQRNQVDAGDQCDPDLPPGAKDPSSYMSAIRGSAPYWKKYRGDLIAMIVQLGIPTFFLTFSFDDLNSTDSIKAMWTAEHGKDSEPPELTFNQKKDLLNKHPIPAARHFSMRVSKFIQHIKKHAIEIFGYPLIDYSIRIEFQGRGSPHAHCLLWLKGAPKFNTTEGIEFIDKNVSCSLQTEARELALKYQNHNHFPTCYKTKNSTYCRFMFPKKVCSVTTVVDDADIDDNGGRFVNLKREADEANINNYHPILLHILRCNMDIQPVTGAMAIAFYIAKYMSKPEPAEIRTQIQASMDSIMKSSLSAHEKMNRIALTLMKFREICAQEAAFRLCHLYLKKSSRACIFVPAFLPENRLRMVRLETIGQDPKFCLNVIDRYTNRPNCLKDICLFEFAAHYQPHRDQKRKEHFNEDEDVEEFPDEEPYSEQQFEEQTIQSLRPPADKRPRLREPLREIHANREIAEENIGNLVGKENPEMEIIGRKMVFTLLNNLGKIEKRSFPAIVKYPNFDIEKDPEAYYYCMLLLYRPFGDENFCNADNAAQFFNDEYLNFRTHSDDPNINPELAASITQALLRVAEYTSREEREQQLHSQVEEQDDVPLTAEEVFDARPINYGEVLDQVKSMVATLSDEQRAVFDQVNDTLKKNEPTPIRLFVCGEGGTGKSYLIRLLSLLIRSYYNQQDSLIISAPTGKAAFNVKGTTLHRTFALPVQLGNVGNLYRLGSRKLEEFRHLYKGTKFLFVDEISMVSYQNFRMVHSRLSEIYQNEEPFANKNVILFGDLMQLKPPRGAWIFKKPTQYLAEIDLWRLFKFYELKVNFRQAGIDPLLSICSRLRVGKLETADVEILYRRLLQESNPQYAELSDNFKNCVWVFPTIAQVNKFNENQTQKLRNAGTIIYNWLARDVYVEGFQRDTVVPPDMVYKKEDRCGGLPSTLELGVGTRVMLRRNKDVKLGLVNGAMGTVVGFEWTFGYQNIPNETMPAAVIVKFDHMDQPVKVEPAKAEFQGKNHKLVRRWQIPLIVAFAINIHKIQGDTMEQLVLDLGPKLFAKAMAYVGVSRCKTINGLGIMVIDPNKLITTARYTPCDTDALEELARLQKQDNPQLSQ